MHIYRVLGAVGRLLVASGTVILLFVAYQLWGTGLKEARAQSELTEEFSESLQEASVPVTTPEGQTPVPVTAPPVPPPEGEAVAILRIPAIGMEKTVVEGVGVADLKKGPGHYPTSPLPGQPGNAAIAGHRTTYGAPFYDFDQLEVGDEILVRTVQGEFRYEIDRTMVVQPDQVEVLDPTDEARLTLTTCHPRYTARQRLVVSAVLTGEPAPGPAPEASSPADGLPADDGLADELPAEELPAEELPADELPAEELADEELADEELADEELAAETELEGAGLSGDPAARGPAALWGALAAAVWLAIALVGRAWRRWPAYLLGAPVLLIVLYVFFENVARLFPANI